MAKGKAPKSGKKTGKDVVETTEGFWMKNYGLAKEEGVGAALKNNFGGDAFKNRKMGVALKGAGTVVGLGMLIDALGRGEYIGAEGSPQDRSFGGRFGEGVIGLALAGGSALHGGRSV